MENYYKEIKKILKDQYWYNDDIIDQIYNKITEYTNKNLNFEYYQSGYDDVISDDIIDDFLDHVKEYYKDWFDDLKDAKIAFSDYIYEKYFFDYDVMYYYEKELKDQLEFVIEKKDWSVEYTDWWDIIRLLQENLWILSLDIDAFGLCKSEYRIVLYTKMDWSSFSTIFDGYRYNDNKKYIKDLKKGSIMQKLCKKHWFDIEDIFKYQNCKEGSKNWIKYKNLRLENEFFDQLYREFANTFGYYEDLAFLLKLWIDDILNFYVKWSKFNLKNTWSIGLYDSCNGSGSLFEVKCKNDCTVDCKDLILRLYDKTNIDRVYGFCDCVFY